jgi:hypothetical protein
MTKKQSKAEPKEQPMTTKEVTPMSLQTPTVSSIPSLHAFDARSSTWESYRDRIGFYFKANRITTAEDKKALFLWAVGRAAKCTPFWGIAPHLAILYPI